MVLQMVVAAVCNRNEKETLSPPPLLYLVLKVVPFKSVT